MSIGVSKTKRKAIRRWVAVGLLLVLAAAAISGRSVWLWTNAWLHDRPVEDILPPGYADDASRLNRTPITERFAIPRDPAAAETQLRELLLKAHERGLHVAIAGARHTMGGHTIYPDGIVIDMLPFDAMECDTARRILHVGAGCRWSAVIPYLNERGLSVGVMQSNDTFTVGGSISANCHGWQHDQPPIASTVESFRLMQADGTIVRCSRNENAELFGLVLGGYGLFGVILDVELRVVPNERYRPEVLICEADQYVTRFDELVRGAPDVGMCYGRLCIVPGDDTFLREAIMVVFRRAPGDAKEMPKLAAPGLASLRRSVHRAQIDSHSGKEVRWKAEKMFSEQLTDEFVSRNQLLNEGVSIYQEQNADRTDILQEYFIPPDRLAAFLARARTIIPAHHGDLLNVTVRTVREDRDSFLRYADQDMFALVMLFSQLRTPEGDRQMQSLAQELTDAALACGGRFYLPYRLHASMAQLQQAYPQAAEFFDKKRIHDADELFENQFYLKYGHP